MAVRPTRGPGEDEPHLTVPADALVELAGRLQAACIARGITVATAESCTGGLVSHLLTEVPGSSAYLRGGIVAYADDVKRAALGVRPDVLEAHGAVSAQVALAMAEGVRERLGADLAVGVTGIAGPGGGTTAKPVGLVYIAVSDAQRTDVLQRTFRGPRQRVREWTAHQALDLVRRKLM